MIRVHGAELDTTYLRRWAGVLGVSEPLEVLLGSPS